MTEFKINKFITLKLEKGKTNIYINGVLFNQCKYIIARKKISEVKDLLKIESIDELTENLDHSLENIEPQFLDIPVETQFWVHCSNLQVWAENNYDTRLSHSNLAFPLLKKLTEVGDPIAIRIFKEEIAKRFASNYPSVINFLSEKGYDKYLSREDFFNSIISINQADTMIELEKIVNTRYCLTDKIDKPFRDVGDEQVYFAIKDKHVTELELYYDKSYPEFLLDLIHNLTDLKILYLYINEETDVFPKISHKFDSLLELKIGIDGWTKIPDIFDKFQNLKKLQIFGGKTLNNFDSIINLKSLETLKIHDVRVKNVPKNIGELKLLKTLSLHNTQTEKLPESIGKLKNLLFLSLTKNRLKNLPKSIKKLKKIKKIYLDKYLSDE